jgi:hypothetical protein
MKRFLKDYAVTALCAMLRALVALPAHAEDRRIAGDRPVKGDHLAIADWRL